MTRRNRSTQTQTQNNTTADPTTTTDTQDTVTPNNPETPDTDATPQANQDIPIIEDEDYVNELLIKTGWYCFRQFVDAVKAKDPLQGLNNLPANEQVYMLITGKLVYLVKTKNPAASKEVNIQTSQAISSAVKELSEESMLKVLRHLARNQNRCTDEVLKSYKDFGPLYAGVPLGFDFGLEIGFATGEGDNKQRNGASIGFRSDALRKVKPMEAFSLGAS